MRDNGLKHVGIAGGPWRSGNTAGAIKRAAHDFNRYGAAARERGIKFHQHDPRRRVRVHQRPARRSPPRRPARRGRPRVPPLGEGHLLGIRRTAPLRQAAGRHPRPFGHVLAKPDRYPLFHVQDAEHEKALSNGYRMVDVGDSDIDCQEFISGVNQLMRRRPLPGPLRSLRRSRN
ncbi:hypothetical protein ACWDZ4_32005 [Streptomyces sp. NPDC003016]